MSELKDKVIAYNTEMKTALETVFGTLNHGQKKQLLKNEIVVALFERYKIDIKEE